MNALSVGEFLARATACVKAGDVAPAAASDGVELPTDQAPVMTHFAPGLHVVYLVDTGDRLQYMQRYYLAALKNAPEAGLHELGLLNLSRRATDKLRIVTQSAVRGLLLDGMFEASLILLDDLWDGPLAAHAPNGPVAALPARDMLAFCDAASPQGLDELRALVRRVTESSNNNQALTRKLYRRMRGRWMPMDDPPAGTRT